MNTYLSLAGATLLQTAFSNGFIPISITGSQVGSTSGFTPDDTMNSALGTIIIDNKNQPTSVKMTPIHLHEIMLTVILGRDLEFTSVGNILIFANNQPFIWLVSNYNLPKVKTDPVAHFSGDKYYFPTLLRYPYIKSLITFNNASTLGAKFPVYDKISHMSLYTEERPNSDQVFVEQNTLASGQGNPFFATKSTNGKWMSNPIMGLIGDQLDYVGGNSTIQGGK